MSMHKQIRQAVALYESFRERKPKKIGRVSLLVPKAVACIGYVEGIDYRTTHGSEPVAYHHSFAAGSRPLFAVSADGRQLILIGGRFKFTERGIVDRDARGREIENPHHGKTANPRLRQKDVFAELRALGLKVKKTEYGEFRVAPAGLSKTREEDVAYYTDDLTDALGTGKAMLREIGVQTNPTAAQILDDTPPVAMSGFDGAPVKVGDRVEMHPATEQWKSGERFGVVTKLLMGSPLRAVIRLGRRTIRADGIYFRLTRRTP